MNRIYLDWAAGAPLRPEAREAAREWLEAVGNPSSLHENGRRARAAIDVARESVAQVLGCEFGEVVFTSGGTESASLAILGAALGSRDKRRSRVLASAVEHPCVLDSAKTLERLGYRFETLPVLRNGVVDLEELERQLASDVLLVCLMHANNEIGTIQPVREAANLAHQAGAVVFSDAVQTFCQVPWTVADLGADLVAVSSHKIGGPGGAGAVYVRGGTPIGAVAVGGGQERELRAGTENVAAISGFGKAVLSWTPEDRMRTRSAANGFREAISRLVEDVEFTLVDPQLVLGSIVHLRIRGSGAESMLIALDRLGVSASSGAACSAGSLEPSHVLIACGFSLDEAKEGLRFSFGPSVSTDDAIEAAERVATAAAQVRRGQSANR